MWPHHLVIPLLLFFFLIRSNWCNEVDKRPMMLSHYYNLLTMGESWLSSKFEIDSNGTFFLAQEKRKIEIGFRNRSLYLIFPTYIPKTGKRWHTKIVIDFDSVGKSKPENRNQNTIEMTITLQHNHIHVYDGCDEIYSGFEKSLDLRLDQPQISVLENWQGTSPLAFQIGSGWPIGQQCKSDGVKKKYAEYYEEVIEMQFQANPENSNRVFYETVVAPPDNFEGCKIDNVLLKVGESRTHECNQCTCESRDNVVCQAIVCPPVSCENPITRNGDCCPTCGQECFHEDHKVPNAHGEVFWPGDCYRCHCWNGETICNSELATCDPLPCPKEDWVYNEKFNCCPKCRDFAHFCELHPCHKDADCVDLKRGPKCSCNTGFQGNGTYCEDIDECAFSQDAREQLGGCFTGSVCRNLPGSFKCDCLPGFQMIGDFSCLPLIRV